MNGRTDVKTLEIEDQVWGCELRLVTDETYEMTGNLSLRGVTMPPPDEKGVMEVPEGHVLLFLFTGRDPQGSHRHETCRYMPGTRFSVEQGRIDRPTLLIIYR